MILMFKKGVSFLLPMNTPVNKDIEYSTVTEVSGPLLVVEEIAGAAYGEVVKIRSPTGEMRLGQVLEAHQDKAIIQVFEGTKGLDTKATSVRFIGEPMKMPLSTDLLGRVFSGTGKPIDGGPAIIPE